MTLASVNAEDSFRVRFDAFRRTLAGQLLLGRYFSARNIVAYLIAIALASLADARFRRQLEGVG